MRIMGLDIGTKNIGVALSDEAGTLAQGKEVIQRTSDAQAIVRVKEILKEFRVGEIVVGLPINMNGSVGQRAEDSIRFAERLRREIHVPLKLWDERLSTREVERVLIEASVRRSRRRKIVDKLAAQIILQNYLDSGRKQH